MNEGEEKGQSCLAITEKKPQRTGGCVGIFFQLFDWNRRLAKKKLFPKKLLPAARAKQAAKKFGGDEKLPVAKLLLIADENSGGFPNMKKNGNHRPDSEQTHEMKSPGLVARLMGLESMPSVQRDKVKKITFSDVKEEKTVSNDSGSYKEDLHSEKIRNKIESRPQKLQKTGPFDRRAVTRFGAEALQFKSVLSRSRKHQPKLVPLMKSPRIPSGKNASSRLMDAATRILEPGLQATNKAKYALTFSNPVHSSKDDFIEEGSSKHSIHLLTTNKSLRGQSSCKNCGNLFDVVETRPNIVEQPPVPASSRPFFSSVDQERDVTFQCGRDPVATFVFQPRKSPHENQDQWHSSSPHCSSQKDVPSNIGLKHKAQMQNQMSLGRDRTPPSSRISNLQNKRVSPAVNTVTGAKDFVALNRSLSGRTQPRMNTKVDSYKFESSSQVRTPLRKRRTVNADRKIGTSGFVNSSFDNQRSVKSGVLKGKEMGFNGQSMSRHGVKTSRDNDVSFSFSSPVRDRIGAMLRETEEKRRLQRVSGNSSCVSKKLILDEEIRKTCLKEPFPLSGDALGAIIEQKMKELTHKEADESEAGLPTHGRSTAVILQELISALTSERHISPEDGVFGLNQIGGHKMDMNFQDKERTAGSSVEFSHGGDHFSPGSVLEASFSNDSFVSSIVDDSSGHKTQPDFMDYRYNHSQASEPDTDLLDSASSLDKGKTTIQMLTEIPNHIAKMLQSTSIYETGLSGHKLAHATQVMSNTELLLRNTTATNDYLIGSCLLGKLETRGFILGFLSFEDTKEGNRVRALLFDCMIEWLDNRYSQYCNSGFKTWTRLPLSIHNEGLVTEVENEIRRWVGTAGKVLDEMIDLEMSRSMRLWTGFEIEGYETGEEIDGGIIEVLVDEVVMDLWEFGSGSS